MFYNFVIILAVLVFIVLLIKKRGMKPVQTRQLTEADIIDQCGSQDDIVEFHLVGEDSDRLSRFR